MEKLTQSEFYKIDKALRYNTYTNCEEDDTILNKLKQITEKEDLYYCLFNKKILLLFKLSPNIITESYGANILDLTKIDRKEYQVTKKSVELYDKKYLSFLVPVEEIEKELNND